MGVGDLISRMVLDSKPWETSLARADAKASAFADKVEHKLSKKISKLFGAGMFAGMLYQPFSKLQEALFSKPFEHAEKIAEGANKLHITAEEYQMLEMAAADAGKSVEDFIKSVQDGKLPLIDAIAQLEQYRNKITMTGDAVDAMTDGSFGKRVAKTGEQVDNFFYQGLVDLFTGYRLLVHNFDWRHPINSFKQSRAQNLEGWGPSAGVSGNLAAALLNPDSPKALRDAPPGINEWQRVGEYVGGNVISDTLNRIAQSCQETAKNTGRLVPGGSSFGGRDAGGSWNEDWTGGGGGW